MQVARGVEMLAVFVVVVLMVPSATEGRLVDTCQLRDELNQTLNASLLNHLTTVAQIVCQVKLVSGFNTSAVHQISLPEVHYGHGKRRARSASSSSREESSEEDAEMPNLAFSTSTVGPVTHQRDNMSFTENGHGPRHARSVEESNSMESSEDDHGLQGHGFNSSSVGPATQQNASMSVPKDGHGSRHARSVRMLPNEKPRPPTPSPRSDFVKTTLAPKPSVGRWTRSARNAHAQKSVESGEDSTELHNVTAATAIAGHGNRRGRSVHQSSDEESNESDFRKPKPSLNSTTSPQGNGSTHVKARRRVRSAPCPSSTECEETDVWTFYGLFQLPGRIACISENEPSYNLCKTTCDKLTNDDISDDIACVQTILNKTQSLLTCKRCGPIENVIKKMVSLLYKKECANVVDTSYFSACKH